MISLTKVDCSRGSPMGRRETHRTGLTDPLFELERIPLIDGGYDCGGAYWGTGGNLWCADFTTPLTGTEIVRAYYRANDREQAMRFVRKDYPSAKFAPETGSIIEQTIQHLQSYLDQLDAMGDEDVEDDAEQTEHFIDVLKDELDIIKEENK